MVGMLCKSVLCDWDEGREDCLWRREGFGWVGREEYVEAVRPVFDIQPHLLYCLQCIQLCRGGPVFVITTTGITCEISYL